MPRDPTRVNAVFQEAIGLPTGEARIAFLDHECQGDAGLRAQVDDLLAAHVKSDITAAYTPDELPPPSDNSSALPASPDPDATSQDLALATPPPADPSTGIGTTLAGGYTLTQVIGEGGMGAVYQAEQVAPVRRQVAVKLIRQGAGSQTVTVRFEAERQALALMDHPNIARVYDGGTTEHGQPFLVMELVRGVPITQYCDQHRLPPKERLELFLPVCDAIQHAHQKGIIHRDIKPGNVLVAEVDGRPVPKVIDFGVAKATEHQTEEESDAIVGTPLYMSPEQADPLADEIDTRTDIYALGAMLYELLSGQPPIDAQRFKRAAIFEMLRLVRETDPPQPSTKASAAPELPSIAAQRALEPGELLHWLRGDINSIVMKALEKERARRYDSADGLARDIQRLLANEAAEEHARKKSSRRSQGQVAAAVLVVLLVTGGALVASLGMTGCREQRQRADLLRVRHMEAAW